MGFPRSSRFLAAFVMLLGILILPAEASAAPAEASMMPAKVGPVARTACTITDHRPIGLSGLIVTDSGFISISDSNLDKSAIRVWFFDQHCRVTRSISYPTSAYDPEDVAIGRDGTLYVADIGDNDRARKSIAIWRIRPGSSTPHIFRYRYPDHPHDAEALLLAADDTPIVVTKDLAEGDIFGPAGPADPSGKPVLLKRVGTFIPAVTGTPGFLGIIGTQLVTGGANSRDRSMVALRTYEDAYVWDVVGGDVVKTITTSTPRIIPLPNEPQGEGIAFDQTGTHLYTISDQETEPVKTKILEYPLPSNARPSPSGLPTGSPSGHTPAVGRATPELVGPSSAVILGGVGAVLLLAIAAVVVVVVRRGTAGKTR